MRSRSYLFAATALLVVACTSSNEPATTTTTTTMPSTTTTTMPSTTATTSTTTTSAPSTPSFPEYRIAERIISVESGDTVVLLLDPASYTSLSDLDLYDVIADAVDRFPPIFEAHVVDSEEAVTAILAEEPDEDQQRILAEHYFVRLEDGFLLVYVGPFEGTDDAVLGS